jgi:hypothetical protein
MKGRGREDWPKIKGIMESGGTVAG